MQNFFSSLNYIPKHPLLYNSVLFFILFAAFYAVYTLTHNKVKLRNVLLLLFSIYFYYKISGLFVILLILMATSDYFIGRVIFSSKKEITKKFLLFLSLFINIGALVYFKYTNFLIETWFGFQGIESPIVLNIIMPIGISFYVFKTLSYIIDIYRELIDKPEKNYINYVLYVSFFPNVLAGPISKARDLLPQIENKIVIDKEKISRGFFLILCGAFKKIVIADYLAANLVDRVFESSRFFTGFENLMATYGAMMQFYCDFSGYTDIVIGIALLLGFIVEPNFNQPLIAHSLTDFWRRWHITLLKWLTEYIYLPISFSLRKIGKIGIVISVMITFLISGIWHGPNITYILWGLLHGVVLSLELVTQKLRSRLSKIFSKRVFNFIGGLITFHFLALSIILFKSNDIPSALAMYSKIFNDFNFSVAGQWVLLYMNPFLVLILGYVLHFLPETWKKLMSNWFTQLHWSLKAVLIFMGMIVIYQAFSSETQPFIYLTY